MYVINLDDKQSKGIHWVSSFIDKNIAMYFDSFGIEYIVQEELNKIKDKSIIHWWFYYVQILLYYFYKICYCRKNFSTYFFLMAIKRMAKLYISNIKANMASLELRIKKNRWNKKLFLKKIKDNKLISKKYEKVCWAFNYFDYFLIFISVESGCVSISAFVSLVGITIGITSSAVGLIICAITTGIK